LDNPIREELFTEIVVKMFLKYFSLLSLVTKYYIMRILWLHLRDFTWSPAQVKIIATQIAVKTNTDRHILSAADM